MTTTSMPESTSEPEPSLSSVSGLLVIACVFTVVGGFTDAYSFLAHDHVFANAQTGNVVFLAVYVSARDWSGALRHLPPIGAYVLGTAIGKALGAQPVKRTFRATLICQAIELFVLFFLSFGAVGMRESYVVPLISFAAALQNSSFGAVGPWTFNSAMTTGNLRNATSGFVLWQLGRHTRHNRSQFVVSALAIISFSTGAFLGAFITRFAPNYALVPCLLLVSLGLVLTLRQRIQMKRLFSGERDEAPA